MRLPGAWTVRSPSLLSHVSPLSACAPTAFRGELISHHPHFHPASPAVCKDIDIKTAKQILPDRFTVNIHMGTWYRPGEPYDAAKVHEDIQYTKEDDEAIDNWITDHVETTWHSLGTCGESDCVPQRRARLTTLAMKPRA